MLLRGHVHDALTHTLDITDQLCKASSSDHKLQALSIAEPAAFSFTRLKLPQSVYPAPTFQANRTCDAFASCYDILS